MNVLHIPGAHVSFLANIDHLAAIALDRTGGTIDAIAYLHMPTEQTIVKEHVQLKDATHLDSMRQHLERHSIMDRVGVDKGAPTRFFTIGDAMINLRFLHSLRSQPVGGGGKTLYRLTFTAPIQPVDASSVPYLAVEDARADLAAQIAAHINL